MLIAYTVFMITKNQPRKEMINMEYDPIKKLRNRIAYFYRVIKKEQDLEKEYRFKDERIAKAAQNNVMHYNDRLVEAEYIAYKILRIERK